MEAEGDTWLLYFPFTVLHVREPCGLSKITKWQFSLENITPTSSLTALVSSAWLLQNHLVPADQYNTPAPDQQNKMKVASRGQE